MSVALHAARIPFWTAVYQQARSWLQAQVFEQAAHDLRVLLRLAKERNAVHSAVILDGRTLQSTPESGARAGYDGHKKKKGFKVHVAVDTLGHLLAMVVTPANEQERVQVAALAQEVQTVCNQTVESPYCCTKRVASEFTNGSNDFGVVRA